MNTDIGSDLPLCDTDIEEGEQRVINAGFRFCCVSYKTKIIADAVVQEIEDRSESTVQMNSQLEEILERILSDETDQTIFTFTKQTASFYCIVFNRQFTFLCITEASTRKSIALRFLQDLEDLFFTTVGCDSITQGIMNQEIQDFINGCQKSPSHFLTEKMKPHFQKLMSQHQRSIETSSKLEKIRETTIKTRQVLTRAAEKLLERGEKLNQLYNDVVQLKEKSWVFKRASTNLKKTFMKRNKKYIIISACCGGAALLIVIIALSIAFG